MQTADYCLEVLEIGELLLRNGLKEEVLRKVEDGIPGGAHLLVEMKPQFMNIWWWLLGTAIMTNKTHVIDSIANLWPSIIADWKESSDFEHPDDIVVLMNVLLADTYLGILSEPQASRKPLRKALTADDDRRLQNILLKSITLVDGNFLQDLRESASYTLTSAEIELRKHTPWLSFSPTNDPIHVDVRMIYTSLLAWTLLRLRREDTAELDQLKAIWTAPASYFREYVLPAVIPLDGLRIGNYFLTQEQVRQGLMATLYECQCPEKEVLSGTPCGEPHAGYIFCVVNSLYLLVNKQEIKTSLIENTEQWLRERMPNGDDQPLCSGRPGKGGDVCYCFWVQGALHGIAALRGHEFTMDEGIREALRKVQNQEDKSLGKAPGAPPDIFHTFFGNLAISASVHSFFGAPDF